MIANLKEIKPGTKLVAEDGYGTRYGVAYGYSRNRWGESIRVKMEDYTFCTTSHVSDAPGIGWKLAKS